MISDFTGRRPLPIRDYVVSRGWSYVMKSRVKSMTTPCVTELDRLEVRRENQFFPYNFAKHGLAKRMIIYFITRDHPRSKPHGP